MKIITTLVLVLITFFSADGQKATIYKIAFGSCSKQTDDQRILNAVVQQKPDLFIYLGDNIYADTRDMELLRCHYQELAQKKPFQKLKKRTPLLATWDDHDYGEDDAGRHYPMKKESKEVFLNFWEEPKASERWQHDGVYHAVFLENCPIKIQVILLDTRTFRDNLTPMTDTVHYKNDYQPTTSPDSTFLGKAQWAWLKKQLEQPADLRIIASSNQFATEYHGWESWRNVPHEHERMLKLLQSTKANGVVFISGDVHYGELSKLENDYTYPIYDITSSSLTRGSRLIEPNKHRIGKTIQKNNYGLIEIESQETTILTFKLLNQQNKVIVNHKIDISNLSYNK